MLRPDLKSGHSKTLNIINLLAGLLLLIAVLLLARDSISFAIRRPAATAVSMQREQQGLRTKSLPEYELILKNNPFGFPAGNLKLLSVSPGQAASSTEVVLMGTIAGAGKHSYAIFADRSGKQEVFRLGESVFGLGSLKRVDKDRVFISGSAGHTEIPLADIIRVIEVNAPQGNIASSGLARNIGEGAYLVDQRKIQQAIENPNQLMTDARLQPNFTEGRQEGFILREVKTGGIYQSLGLQNNDVLLRINDYNISNPESGLQAFTALRGMDRVRLDILRNNARMTLTYQIK